MISTIFLSRWETDVVAKELHGHTTISEIDNLAEEFDAIEEEQALRSALKEIIDTSTQQEQRQ